ncbi:MAG: HEPN domain-containing protein [Chloroflexi bacterium]|nr:HEPN domain-containing protein [Chloroflexota bacterium]
MSASVPRIKQLITLAEQALTTAQVNFETGDFRATVNRTYYAIFYAASAMLLTLGLERRKHSGVISAFRKHLVKSGLIEAEYSNIYGETLIAREDADYTIEVSVASETAELVLDQARRFVQRMREYLVEKGFLDETVE